MPNCEEGWMTRSIAGDLVDDVYGGYGLPAFSSPVTFSREAGVTKRAVRESGRAESARPGLVRLLAREIAATSRSLRSGDGPRNVLHALMMEDDVTAGEIAGIIHSDPQDSETVLSALAELGIVGVDYSRPMQRYTLGG
jgi:hypothetical protein